MIVTIDGRPLDADEVRGHDLEQILEDLQTRHVSPGRTIVEVFVDGKTYSEGMPHEAVGTARGGIKTLDLATKSAEEIVLHFVENGQALITGLVEALPRIAELFRLGDEVEGNEYFLRFLNSIQLLVKMMPQMERVFPGILGADLGKGGSLGATLEALDKGLAGLLEIQRSVDWWTLADHLERELPPVLADLRKGFPALEAWVRGRATSQ